MTHPNTAPEDSTSREAEPNEEWASKPADLVRVEQNIDSQPIWAPSKYAEELKRVYPLKWRGDDASVTVQGAGEYGMLRSFDKMVLTALVQLWNEQGRRPDGYVSFRISDIVHAFERKRSGKLYEQIKESLHRLRGCLIQYQFSFFDVDEEEYVSLEDKNILTKLLIVEPRKEGDSVQMPLALTHAVLDFMVVKNLLGNFTRPVSLRLLQKLTERGMLFESYINAVLYRHHTVKKDVFELWADLGLSTKSLKYGSRIASRMRDDLDLIAADENSLLASYSFEKSRTRARSQNLILVRKQSVDLDVPKIPKQHKITPREQYEQRNRTDGQIDQIVEWLKLELHDESDNDANLRVIARRMPEDVVKQGAYQAFADYRDGKTRSQNPAAYFVGMMKNRASELGIRLGFAETTDDAPKAAPKPISMRRGPRGTTGLQSMSDLVEKRKKGR